jgi:GrpB-like predicted nucleotidyltransferase (UPF0157 family)
VEAPSPDRIVIATYNPDWPVMFEREHEQLLTAIGEWAVAIEHVGSTSVPGLAAKPVIDIGVPLRGFEDALYCITPLYELGYECLGEYGIPGRIYFRKPTARPLPGQTHNNGIGRTHQIHMYRETHVQYRWQLAFRDHLRANPVDARQYESLKRRLAAELDDVEEYAEVKTDFVMTILRKARAAEAAS